MDDFKIATRRFDDMVDIVPAGINRIAICRTRKKQKQNKPQQQNLNNVLTAMRTEKKNWVR